MKARVKKRQGRRFMREMRLRALRVRGHNLWTTFVAYLREHFKLPEGHPEVAFWRMALEGVRHGDHGGIADAFRVAERVVCRER